MKGVSTAFWSIVLCGSVASIGAGFVGGRSIGTAGALPAATDVPLPEPMRQRVFTRALAGAHSLDVSEADDPYARPELAVVDRPALASFDARRQRAKLAVIAIGPGGGPAFTRVLASPLPIAVAIEPGEGAADAVDAVVRAGKVALAEAGPGAASAARLVRAGAIGVIGSLDADRSRTLLRSLGRDALVVDAVLGEDDALGAVARRAGHRVIVRDAIADARDDRAYLDFMLRTALAIAQRNGRAVVAVHLREESLDALTRLADRAQRAGVDLVPLTDL